MLKQIFFWAAFSWTAIVLFLCLIQLNNVPDIGIPNLDKYVHAFFHFVFTLLWFLFFNEKMKDQNRKPYVISFLLSLFFGITIEILQGVFTTTRKADVFDVLANVSGASSAVLVLLFYFRIKLSKKK